MAANTIFDFEVVKISGTPTETFWSGNFAEIPKDSEKLSLRGQLFLVISLKTKNEPAGIAHQFWTELSGQFYTNLAGGVLVSLRQAAEKSQAKLPAELEEFGFVAASVWGKVLYLVGAGGVSTGLIRAGKFSKVLTKPESSREIASASGFLQDNDLVFLASEEFFGQFTNLAEFAHKPSWETEEELASRVSNSPQPEKIAATILKIKEVEGKPTDVVAFVEPSKVGEGRDKLTWLTSIFRLLKQAITNFLNNFFPLITSLSKKLTRFIPRRNIYLDASSRRLSGKKVFSLVLIILILVLVVSLSIGVWQRQRRLNLEKFNAAFSQAEMLYEESGEIVSINKLRSRELLGQAQQKLEEAKKYGFEKEKVAQLAEKINLAKRESLKLVKVENPELIFDLSLLKAGAEISGIEKTANILAFDKSGATLFLVDLVNKTGQITAGGEGFSGFGNFTLAADFAYFFKPGDGVYQLNLETRELAKVVEADSAWSEILGLANFSSNLYLLDGGASQVWKYAGSPTGFSETVGFLTQTAPESFADSSFAIDGFIWVMTGSGKIYQLTPNEAKLIEVTGLDKPTSAKTILRTNFEAENLYIGDIGNSRILVLSKNGLYLAQYTSGLFSQMSDFVVDEPAKKIYFAVNSKVYQFDLVE